MIDTDDFLMHYGVLGMKWGVRKNNKSASESVESPKPKAPRKALTSSQKKKIAIGAAMVGALSIGVLGYQVNKLSHNNKALKVGHARISQISDQTDIMLQKLVKTGNLNDNAYSWVRNQGQIVRPEDIHKRLTDKSSSFLYSRGRIKYDPLKDYQLFKKNPKKYATPKLPDWDPKQRW